MAPLSLSTEAGTPGRSGGIEEFDGVGGRCRRHHFGTEHGPRAVVDEVEDLHLLPAGMPMGHVALPALVGQCGASKRIQLDRGRFWGWSTTNPRVASTRWMVESEGTLGWA